MKKIIFSFLLLMMIPHAAHAMDSAYTSLEEKSCKMIQSGIKDADVENDSFEMSCPGRNGFAVKVVGGDSRSWIVLTKNGQEIYNSQNDIASNLSGNFPAITGKVLEWRYDANKKLVGLIVRVGTQDANDANKNNSDLIVLRQTSSGFCYLGTDKTNVGARKIADGNGTCR